MSQHIFRSSSWLQWLRIVGGLLDRGGRLPAPLTLPTPAAVGFQRIVVAEPVGQIRDWGLALADGGRIHVHEFADGRLVVHKDRIDPSRGPLQAVGHWLTESRSGRLALAAGAAVLLWRALRRDS